MARATNYSMVHIELTESEFLIVTQALTNLLVESYESNKRTDLSDSVNKLLDDLSCYMK